MMRTKENSCERVTWQPRLTMTVLCEQDITGAVRPLSHAECASVQHENNVRVVRVWWDVLFTYPVASLVVYHLNAKQ